MKNLYREETEISLIQAVDGAIKKAGTLFSVNNYASTSALNTV